MRVFEYSPRLHSPQGAMAVFVDENGTTLCFEIELFETEDYGWFISEQVESTICMSVGKYTLKDYSFDETFFRRCVLTDNEQKINIVVFRLVSRDQPAIYLHLYNLQDKDGPAAHAFVFKNKYNTIKLGRI